MRHTGIRGLDIWLEVMEELQLSAFESIKREGVHKIPKKGEYQSEGIHVRDQMMYKKFSNVKDAASDYFAKRAWELIKWMEDVERERVSREEREGRKWIAVIDGEKKEDISERG